MAKKASTMPVLDVTFDGATRRVHTSYPDACKYDMAVGRKFPPSKDAPLIWLGFMAHAALKRDGDMPYSFDQFRQLDDLEIETVDEAEVNPTRADPDRDSSSNSPSLPEQRLATGGTNPAKS